MVVGVPGSTNGTLPCLVLTAHFGAHSDKKKKYIYNILPQFAAPVRKVYSVSKAFSDTPMFHDMLTGKKIFRNSLLTMPHAERC